MGQLVMNKKNLSGHDGANYNLWLVMPPSPSSPHLNNHNIIEEAEPWLHCHHFLVLALTELCKMMCNIPSWPKPCLPDHWQQTHSLPPATNCKHA